METVVFYILDYGGEYLRRHLWHPRVAEGFQRLPGPSPPPAVKGSVSHAGGKPIISETKRGLSRELLEVSSGKVSCLGVGSIFIIAISDSVKLIPFLPLVGLPSLPVTYSKRSPLL